MALATYDDSKTQTRRIIKNIRVRLPKTVCSDAILTMCKGHIPIECKPGIYKATMNQNGAVSVISEDGRPLGVKPGEFNFICPYADGETHLGDYGDKKKRWTITPKDSRLWVKETFQRVHDGLLQKLDPDPESPYWQTVYRADGIPAHWEHYGLNWKPSIFMPRKLSRITLEITGVRVERLQDISRGDCMSEGCPFPNISMSQPNATNPKKWYSELWESINGKGSWSKNPWVWVIEFKRL
jgi:hypothetical protein